MDNNSNEQRPSPHQGELPKIDYRINQYRPPPRPWSVSGDYTTNQPKPVPVTGGDFGGVKIKRQKLSFGEGNMSVIWAFIAFQVSAAILLAIPVVLSMMADIVAALELGPAFSWIEALSTAVNDFFRRVPLFATLVAHIFLIFGTVLYLRYKKIDVVRTYRISGSELTAKKLILLIPITIGAIALFMPLAELFIGGLMSLGWQIPEGVAMGVPPDLFGIILTFAIVSIAPSISEEFLFRGVMLNGARRRGSFYAIMFTGFIFMLFHTSPLQTVHQLALGIIYAYITIATGNILYAVILHFLNNFIAVALIFIPESFFVATHTIGGLTITNSAIMLICMFVGGIIILPLSLWAFIRDNDKQKGLTKAKGWIYHIRENGFFKSFGAAVQALNDKYDPTDPVDASAYDHIALKDPRRTSGAGIALVVVLGVLWLLSLGLGFILSLLPTL